MATRPTITTVSSGAIYSPTVLNTNFTNIQSAFDALLGTDGTSGTNNDMTGDLNMAGNTIRNALFDSDIAGLEWQGNWATSTTYVANDVVRDTTDNILYICVLAHTSSGTEPLASNADAANWEALVDASSLTGLADIVDDSTPQLGGDLDTNSMNIQFDDAHGIYDDSGNEQLLFQKTASAANYYEITNQVASSNPTIGVEGSDTNIDISLVPKGSGTVDVNTSIIENVTDPTSAQHAATKNYVDTQIASTSPALPRGYITGYVISNNSTDANHDIDITTGGCRNTSNDGDINLTSGLTKRIDATWSAGTGNGGLSSSLSAPANNTWYHVHAIIVSGSADVGFDTSINAANLIADHSVTAYRRIGSVLTDGSANITAFLAYQTAGGGVDFDWVTPSQVYATFGTETTTSVTATVPTGRSFLTYLTMASAAGNNSFQSMYVRNTNQTDISLGLDAGGKVGIGGVVGSGGDVRIRGTTFVRTNSSGQFEFKSTITNNSVYIETLGWSDDRTV